ncbi:hypothetical protein HYALB_00003844 [Hymenoscyphus albidus]|uniref:Small-subunit processome Utp12 domain-containing protein n=1 Tax=Hymenoscyphus albidus TaxID=595503 RepID=A0A9N9M1A4_9HELO|nr:hypothetical protein HYALB_00003844 [Hymenoscyphus albidus]
MRRDSFKLRKQEPQPILATRLDLTRLGLDPLPHIQHLPAISPDIYSAMSTKRKLPQKLAQPKVNQSAKALWKANLNDSRTVVSAGGNTMQARTNGSKEVVSISSDDEDADSADESAAEVSEDELSKDDIAMTDADAPIPEDAEENAEPSFGDLVRANAEIVDVAGAFEETNAVAYPKGSQIQPPSGTSLGTVLTQALRTNDVSLLESCFHTTDVQIIRNTIQRLESPLAGKLLQKLAERLHRRPGRAGTLMVWVQWTLVAHGGYLTTQKDVVQELSELEKVISERAKGLQPLLSLKGKLDMLDAQIELRRSMQNQRLRMDEDEDDEGIIYVEGQESDNEETAKAQRVVQNGEIEGSDDDSDISEDMPTTNGVIAESDEEESSDDDNLLDDEAEETDEDSADEDEVDHDDNDSDEESDDADSAPPSKVQRTSGVISKKR